MVVQLNRNNVLSTSNLPGFVMCPPCFAMSMPCMIPMQLPQGQGTSGINSLLAYALERAVAAQMSPWDSSFN